MTFTLYGVYRDILRLQKKLRPEAQDVFDSSAPGVGVGGNVFFLSNCFCVLVQANLVC